MQSVCIEFSLIGLASRVWKERRREGDAIFQVGVNRLGGGLVCIHKYCTLWGGYMDISHSGIL